MGGNNLTGPAQRTFNRCQEEFKKNGKILVYIPNEGISRLESEYVKPITHVQINNESD